MAAMGRFEFVFAFQPGPGHWSRMGPIASALKRAGHRVVLATSPSFRPRLDGMADDDFIAIGPPWEEDRLPSMDRLSSLVGGLRARGTAINSFFFGAARQVSADLERALKAKRKPDLLVFDYTLLGGPPAAEALGLPWASVFGLTVPFPVPGWPPFGSHFRFSRSPSVGERYREIEELIVRENRELYAPVRELWRAAGRRVSDPWRPYGRFGRLAIVGSIPECEFPLPPRFPARVRYVGPLIGRESASAGLDKEALAFVRRKEDGPLIHLTLGMTFSETAAVLRKVSAALLDAPVRLLVSSGNLDEDSIRGALPSRRLLVRRTVPHMEVMPEIELLICQGGAGTLMKALYFGVPSLVVPLGAEQRSNGARFVHGGIARMVLPGRLTAKGVREALGALTDVNGGYRGRAKEMGEKARLAGGAEAAASLLEEVCEKGAAL